ncbi:hypothetical protein BIV57_10275 [Mangrovactinospora gilvigrisea]|uniref:DUF4870 domain-containing protein n=1 Tax=Mangrovactinospora gilvigrisea TaxID=1428644 RepID=A0A1J7C7T9_9ACTN|nr:hypothetical protein BIV57_10275 [Mangrovactinospora gilvigrisea]
MLTWVVTLCSVVLGFVPALVVYLVYRDRSPLARQHAATELNAWITWMIYNVVLGVLGFVTIGIAWIVLLALWVVYLVYAIMALVAAMRGQGFSYPKWLAFPMVG